MKHPKTLPEPLCTYVPALPTIEAEHHFEFDDRTLSSLIGQNLGTRNLAHALDNGGVNEDDAYATLPLRRWDDRKVRS